jgi:hypothetical protein
MGVCSISRPGRFTTVEIVPNTHGRGCWVGSRANLEWNNCQV